MYRKIRPEGIHQNANNDLNDGRIMGDSPLIYFLNFL